MSKQLSDVVKFDDFYLHLASIKEIKNYFQNEESLLKKLFVKKNNSLTFQLHKRNLENEDTNQYKSQCQGEAEEEETQS